MKKLISAAIIASSPLAFAISQEQPVKPVVIEGQPTAVIRVFDRSTYKVIEGNKVSRSKPRYICLSILNVPIQDRNLFAQYVQAPAPIDVNVRDAKVHIEENKKNFLIVFEMMKKDIRNNAPAQCWTLAKDDPLGVYKIDAQFNGTVFKGLEFELLK